MQNLLWALGGCDVKVCSRDGHKRSASLRSADSRGRLSLHEFLRDLGFGDGFAICAGAVDVADDAEIPVELNGCAEWSG
jgi:hypothetical protein